MHHFGQFCNDFGEMMQLQWRTAMLVDHAWKPKNCVEKRQKTMAQVWLKNVEQ